MPRLTRKKKAYGGKFSQKKAVKITAAILAAQIATAYMLNKTLNPPRTVKRQLDEPFEFPKGYHYQGQQGEQHEAAELERKFDNWYSDRYRDSGYIPQFAEGHRREEALQMFKGANK